MTDRMSDVDRVESNVVRFRRENGNHILACRRRRQRVIL